MPNINDETPSEIQGNPKLYPFFKDTIGALDGTQILCSPKKEEREAYRNHKGHLTQNCLMACNFNLKFLYVLSGWEGSASDSLLFDKACQLSFPIPNGKYYLADAGFPQCDNLMVPYRGVRYHLKEEGDDESR